MIARHIDPPPPEDIDADALDEVADYDPRHDSEALLLSALLWAGQRGDLYPVRQALEIIERAERDLPTDSASVIATLSAQGSHDGMTRRDTTELMATLLGLQANDLLAPEYARQVLSISYRRQFQRMVTKLAQIAHDAPEDELFNQLVACGQQQRTAWQRFTSRRDATP